MLKMFLRLLKTFGMEEVKAVVDAYQGDGYMENKTNSILVQLGKQIAIGEKRWTELRLGLVQIPVVLDERKYFNVCLIQHGCLCNRDDEAWGRWQTGDITAKKFSAN